VDKQERKGGTQETSGRITARQIIVPPMLSCTNVISFLSFFRYMLVYKIDSFFGILVPYLSGPSNLGPAFCYFSEQRSDREREEESQESKM
jgi:hypothetical protein